MVSPHLGIFFLTILMKFERNIAAKIDSPFCIWLNKNDRRQKHKQEHPPPNGIEMFFPALHEN